MPKPEEITKQCSKCSGKMVWGFFRDQGLQSRWIQSGWSIALTAPKIDTYSCEQCGFCELYVRHEDK